MVDGEEQLVQEAIRGDASAFRRSLRRGDQPAMYRFVLFKCGRREDAEDITHQIFSAPGKNQGQLSFVQRLVQLRS